MAVWGFCQRAIMKCLQIPPHHAACLLEAVTDMSVEAALCVDFCQAVYFRHFSRSVITLLEIWLQLNRSSLLDS